MNTEVIGRMMEAKKYQMMAIKALFPEGKQEHIDNIERELKAMFSESMMECMMKCMSAAGDIKSKAEETAGKTEDEGLGRTEGKSRTEGTSKTAGTSRTSRSASVKKEKVHKVSID